MENKVKKTWEPGRTSDCSKSEQLAEVLSSVRRLNKQMGKSPTSARKMCSTKRRDPPSARPRGQDMGTQLGSSTFRQITSQGKRYFEWQSKWQL